MPLIRYEVTLSPDAQRHPTAFAPVPASTIAKWSTAQAQGWTVTGSPGTTAIAAPHSNVAPGAILAGPGSALPGGAGGAGNTNSRYMPPAWWPSEYWARQELWGGIGGVAAGQLVNARQLEAGRPMRSYSAAYGSGQAVPTTQVPGMRPQRTGRQWLGQRQVAAHPNRPKWKRWGHG